MTQKCRTNTVIRLAVLSFLIGESTVQAQQIVVPNSLQETEGSSNNGYPFNLALYGVSSQRYQQIYAASQFSSLGGSALLTQIAFRPDSMGGGAFSSTLTKVQINLSTTATAPDATSSTFAANSGVNDQIVFGPGPLSLSSSFTGSAAGPKGFDILINLITPFVYNPNNGNLLLDIRNFSGGSTCQFDGELAFGDSVSRIFNVDVNGLTGQVDTLGLVTRFQFTAIPEPGGFILVGAGCIPLLGSPWRRKKAMRPPCFAIA